GALDMKGQGIMELMAFLEVHRSRQTPCRGSVCLAVADEEAMGIKGVQYLLDNFPEELDAGLVLNEGGCGVSDLLPGQPVMLISTAEKASNWLHLSCQGPPGHGSVPNDQNALERLIRGLNRVQKIAAPIIITDVTAEFFKKLAVSWDFLQPYAVDNKEQTLIKCLTESGLASTPQISALVRNTISTNVIQAGSKTNVIPSIAEARLDIRLLPGQDSDAFLAEIKMQLADDEIKTAFITKDVALGSSTDTKDYQTIETILSRHFPDTVTAPTLMIGASDSRFFRGKGINAYGVFPVMLPMADLKMIHGIDEKISEENMITGSVVFSELVKALCEL
ncbi:MAG: M20/M25/M40 family metallo-hydrolase, partial [Deltaproteobacteria bacterium]|nr:M20/M25/M40 family metallo-hydrolase [Deltaproteobacteria bacterium]